MKKIGVWFFVVLARISLAQNLVPNPSFEEYTKCPVNFSTDATLAGPTGWGSATQGTPDYFNKCSIGEMDVPRNWAGVSYAHSGGGYVGIYAWSTSQKNYREYVQCKLSEPLQKGATYHVQFFYRLSSYSVYAIDRIGLALSNSEVKENNDTLLHIKPWLTRINKLEELTNEWYNASGEIIAEGGEQFLIIGNFSNNQETENMKIEYRDGMSFMLSNSAYYYIDDVSVTPKVVVTKIDSLDLSENREIKVNAVYILKKIYFEFDSYSLKPQSEPELNLLVSILTKNPQWKVELSGHTDESGNDLYNNELSLNRAKSVGHYLTQKGIPASRIITKGFGKAKPLNTAKTDAARAMNRRVEVKFLDK